MAKIDQKYVDALNNFSKSLESIVELLQNQVKSRDTDVLETMLKNMDSDKLNKIVEDLKEVSVTTKRIESKIDKMSKELKEIKSSKDGGFGQIVDPKNKGKILDGIKVITLIAGGVLAIGMAFKLIGKVDVLSVIALGISISIVAATFAELNNRFSTLSIRKTILLTGMMVIVSLGIMMSSKILMLTAPLTLRNMVSITFTSLALGSALYLMSKSIEKIKFNLKTVLGFMLLPFLGPIVSFAIVKSSWILKNAADIPFKTILSVTFTSIALGVALWAITTAISKMNMKSTVIGMLTKGAMFGVIVTAVAGAVVIASMILNKVVPISFFQGLSAIIVAITLGILLFAISKVVEFTEGLSVTKVLAIGALMLVAAWAIKKSSQILAEVTPFTWRQGLGLVLTSFAIGLSLIAFVPAWKMFGSSWFSKATAFGTAKNILIVAGTIVLTSWILSAGNYTGPYPSYDWSLKVGLSLVVFGTEVATLGWVVSKIGWQNLGFGAIAAVAVATVMFLSSWIISVGNYSNYPPLDWCVGTGLAIVIFGGAMIGLGFLITATAGLGIPGLALGALGTLMVVTTMMLSSYIIGAGSYGTYPSLKWASGVGLSLVAFGGSMIVLGTLIAATLGGGLILLALGATGVLKVAETIVEVSKTLSRGTYDKGPSLGWATGTGLLIAAVGTTMLATALIPNKVLSWGRESLLAIAQTIVDTSKKLKEGTYEGGPTQEWAEGVATTIVAFAMAISTMGMATGGLKSLLFGIDIEQMKNSISALVDGMVEANTKLSGSNVNWTTNYPTSEWADGVGTAVTKFAEAARILTGGLFSKNITGSFVTSVGILIGGLVEAARQMTTGNVNWSNLPFPQKDWVDNVTLAIKSFLDLSREMRGGFFSKNITDDFVNYVSVLMDGLVKAGQKISGSNVNWANLSSPQKDWVNNINSSIKSFVNLARDFGDEDDFITKIDNLLTGLIHIGVRLSTKPADLIKWSTLPYPQKEWIENISSSIKSFVNLSRDLGGDTNFLTNISTLLTGLIHIGVRFSTAPGGTIKWSSLPYPSVEWVKNVRNSVEEFIMLSRFGFDTESIQNLSIVIDTIISISNRLNNNILFLDKSSNSLDTFVNSLKNLSNNMPSQEVVSRLTTISAVMSKISSIGYSTADSIYSLTRAIKYLSYTMDDIDTTIFDKLTKFSSTFTSLSLIDNLKLQEAINTIKTKRLDIQAVVSDSGPRFASIGSATPSTSVTTINSGMNTETIVSPLQELVNYNKNIDLNIQELLKLQKESSIAESESQNVSKPSLFGWG